jgi:glycerol uptake facilitator-like aquaporin
MPMNTYYDDDEDLSTPNLSVTSTSSIGSPSPTSSPYSPGSGLSSRRLERERPYPDLKPSIGDDTPSLSSSPTPPGTSPESLFGFKNISNSDAHNNSNRGSNHNEPPSANGSLFRSYFFSSIFAEFFGSFLLAFFTLYALYISAAVNSDALSTNSLIYVALIYGCSYGCLVYSFSLNGGGFLPSIRQLNPIITLALFITKKIDGFKALTHVGAQIAGVFCGALLVFFSFSFNRLQVLELYDGTTVFQQLIASIMASFFFSLVLIITNFAVIQPVLQQGFVPDVSEQAPQSVHELNSIATCFITFSVSTIAYSVSSCFVNPAIGCAVLALTRYPNSPIVVIFGPTIGALLSSLVSRLYSYRVRAPFAPSLSGSASFFSRITNPSAARDRQGDISMSNVNSGRYQPVPNSESDSRF